MTDPRTYHQPLTQKQKDERFDRIEKRVMFYFLCIFFALALSFLALLILFGVVNAIGVCS